MTQEVSPYRFQNRNLIFSTLTVLNSLKIWQKSFLLAILYNLAIWYKFDNMELISSIKQGIFSVIIFNHKRKFVKLKCLKCSTPHIHSCCLIYYSTIKKCGSRIFRVFPLSKLQRSLRQVYQVKPRTVPRGKVVQQVNTAAVLTINYRWKKVSNWQRSYLPQQKIWQLRIHVTMNHIFNGTI